MYGANARPNVLIRYPTMHRINPVTNALGVNGFINFSETFSSTKKFTFR